MDMNTIMALVTALVTFVCGLLAKRIPWFNNNLIPIQNLLIGVIAAVVYYLMTGDLSVALASVGLGVGGVYDITRNLQLLLRQRRQNPNKEK